MAADDTDTQTQTAPATPVSPDMLAQALQLSQQLMPQPIQPDTTPAQGGIVGLLGRIGSALAGGSVTDVMSPAQKERAGLRALGDFGTSLMAGSGYYPGKPMFGGLAQGFQGAEASERGSEQQVAAQLGAQQDYQTKQAALRLKALQDALPLLTLDQQSRQAAAARALAGGGAAPGTAAGAGQPGATYESTIGGMEGTGKNPRSSSSGVGGFLDSTWQDFATANPDLFKGMTPAQVMAAKSDPGLGAKAITWLAQRNASVLSDNGVTPSGPSLGIAHYVGPGPAAKIMAAPDNAPVAGFVSPEAVKANPELASMTAGQMKQRYAGVPTPGFLKPAGGPAASAAPLPAPVQTAGPGAPTGGSTPAAPDTTPWDLPGGAAAPATPTPPTDTTTPPVTPPPAPTHPDIPVPGGGVISHPGEFADYRAKQFVPPTGEDFNPNLAPEQQQAFATKAQQLQLAQQQVSTLPFAEQPKALIEVKAKQAELAAAQQDAIAAKRQAAATNVTKYNETQQKDIQTRYDAATAAYNTAAHTQLTGQQAIDLENVKSGNQVGADLLKGYNTDSMNSAKRIDDLELLRGLSDNVGTPTPLTSIKVGGRSLADIISTTGFGGQNLQNKAAAVQAFHSGVLSIVRDLRSGGAAAGEPRSNQDLQFVTDMAPSEWQDPNTRSAIISFLQQTNQRRIDMGAEVSRLMATRLPNGQSMPAGQAIAVARQNLPDFVPQIPGTITAPSQAPARQAWFETNVKPYTFFRYPNGRVDLYKGPPQQGQR